MEKGFGVLKQTASMTGYTFINRNSIVELLSLNIRMVIHLEVLKTCFLLSGHLDDFVPPSNTA